MEGEESREGVAEGDNSEKSFKSNGQQAVVHPFALAAVNDKEVRVVIDTLSSSNYIKYILNETTLI